MDMLRNMIEELETEHGDVKQTMDSLRTVRALWHIFNMPCYSNSR